MYHKDEIDKSSSNKTTKPKQTFKITKSNRKTHVKNIVASSADHISEAESENPTNLITSHSADKNKHDIFNTNDSIKKPKTSKEYMLERNNIQILESGKVQCPKCDRNFAEWAGLKKHYEYIHENITSTCEFCGYKASKTDVDKHVKRKHGSERYNCNQCEYTSTMKVDVRTHHDARHSGVKHMCEDCGSEYSSTFTLQKHKTTKHSGVLLQCNQCDYKMDGQLGTMKNHKRRMHESS